MRPACCVLLCLLVGASAWAEPDRVRTTAHLRIEGRVPQAWIDMAARIGEPLYTSLKARWAREPRGVAPVLRLKLYPDRAAFLAALQAAGATEDVSHAGGFTSWETGDSYVYLQTDAFDTRRLILHELVHQFQAKCLGQRSMSRLLAWYTEGIAEYHGWHDVTTDGVRFGPLATDPIARLDRPAQAAARVRTAAFDPWALGRAKRPADYTDGLALVTALADTRDARVRETFRRWERELIVEGSGIRRFESMFAEHHDALRRICRDAWRGLRRTWRPLTPGWDRMEDAIVGERASRAVIRTHGDEQMSGIRARIDAADGVRAGLVFGLGGPATLAAEVEGTTLRLVRRTSKQTQTGRVLARYTLPGSGAFDLALRRGSQGIVVSARRAGVELTESLTWEWAGATMGPAAGLSVEGGRATFQGVRTN